MNILHISPDFNYACGVSMNVYLILKGLNLRKEINLFFITNKGDSLERLSSLNLKIDYIDFQRGNKNPYKLLKEIYQLIKYCSKNKIDIIHSHHRYAEFLSFIVGKLLRIRTVTTVHSIVKKWNYFSFRSDQIIAVSKTVERNLLEEYKISDKRISLLYHYVEQFENPSDQVINKLKEKYGFAKNEIILLFVGRIIHIKGIDVLIGALELLKMEKHFVKLLVVGEFSTQEFKHTLLNNNRVIYIEPRTNIEELYFVSDIVVMPSRIESLGYVMLEAGLAKKPFIGGRTGGIEEFIEDGVDGLLVEPGNAEDLYKKMLHLLNDANLQIKLGENLYKKVLPLTNKEAYIQQLVSLYEKLLHTSN